MSLGQETRPKRRGVLGRALRPRLGPHPDVLRPPSRSTTTFRPARRPRRRVRTAIEARLRLGLETLSGYDHERGLIVADGEHVVTEHAETWHWPGGESVTLPFVSVQRVVDGTIVLWKDYWDYQTLMNAAPADWQDRLATADLSWLYDATGEA